MSDIATELRRLSSDMGGTPRYVREYYEKGAIEIERLESALAEKAKELERLRKALTTAKTNLQPIADMHKPGGMSQYYVHGVARAVQAGIDAALKETADNG